MKNEKIERANKDDCSETALYCHVGHWENRVQTRRQLSPFHMRSVDT